MPETVAPWPARTAAGALGLALVLSFLACDSTRPPTEAEWERLWALRAAVEGQVERTGSLRQRAAAEAMAAAFERLQVFERDSATVGWEDDGTVGLAAEMVADEDDEARRSRRSWMAFSAYLHEGVHLTQSGTLKTFAREQAEWEAYRLTHSLTCDFLAALLGPSPPRSAFGMASLSRDALIEGFLWLHHRSGLRYFRGRCAAGGRRGELSEAAVEGDGVLIRYQTLPVVARVDFEPDGRYRRTTIPFQPELIEERLGVLIKPGGPVYRGGGFGWHRQTRGERSFDHLLPGYSQHGELVTMSVRWFLSRPEGSMRNHSEEWNESGLARTEIRGEWPHLELAVRIPDHWRPGPWNVGFLGLATTFHPASVLAGYQRDPKAEPWNPSGLIAFMERQAARFEPGEAWLYLDRRPQTVRRLFAFPGLPGLALVTVDPRDPAALEALGDHREGYALPGWDGPLPSNGRYRLEGVYLAWEDPEARYTCRTVRSWTESDGTTRVLLQHRRGVPAEGRVRMATVWTAP